MTQESFMVSNKTREQMERFREWILSADGRRLSLADKGILYTLIGMSDADYTISQVEAFVPDSSKSIHRHIRSLEADGVVTLIPISGKRQIGAMHYRVNL